METCPPRRLPSYLLLNPQTIYNPVSFQTELIVQFMQNKGILMGNRRCPIALLVQSGMKLDYKFLVDFHLIMG